MLTDIDIKILLEFLKLKKDEHTTTWKIMRKLFRGGREKEHRLIERRIDRLAGFGLIEIKGKPKECFLEIDKVYFKKIKFKNRKKEGNCICVLMNKGWEVFELVF